MGIIPDEYLIDYNKYKEPRKELQVDLAKDILESPFEIIAKRLIQLDNRVKQLEEKLNDLEQDSAEVNSY